MIDASILRDQAMAMLLAALPTLAVMSAIAFAPMKSAATKKDKKDKAKKPDKTASKSKASPCRNVIGKLNYAVQAAKTPEAVAAAEERLAQYRAMSNRDKGEFANLFDLNNGSVSWMANYFEKHSSYSKEAARAVEGMMTRSWPYIQANAYNYRSMRFDVISVSCLRLVLFHLIRCSLTAGTDVGFYHSASHHSTKNHNTYQHSINHHSTKNHTTGHHSASHRSTKNHSTYHHSINHHSTKNHSTGYHSASHHSTKNSFRFCSIHWFHFSHMIDRDGISLLLHQE